MHAAHVLPGMISTGIRREFPNARWRDVGRKHEIDTKALEVEEGVSVKVRFVRWREEWKQLPMALSSVRLRYSDLPEVVLLNIPTASSFVVIKLMALADRQAPRDLFDLQPRAPRLHHVGDADGVPYDHGLRARCGGRARGSSAKSGARLGGGTGASTRKSARATRVPRHGARRVGATSFARGVRLRMECSSELEDAHLFA